MAIKTSVEESKVEMKTPEKPGSNAQVATNASMEVTMTNDPETGGILAPIISPVVKGFETLTSPVVKGAEVMVETFLPKIEKLPWTDFFLLSIFVAIPAVGYVVIFTKMGYGLDAFYFLSQYYEQHAYKLGGSLAAFAFLLYLFDFYLWDSKFGRAARLVSVAIIVLGLTVLVCFIAATHPYGPISMNIVMTPIWLVLVKKLIYRKKSMREFVPWLSGPLFLNSMLILSSFIIWTWWDFEHRWLPTNRLADAEKSGCTANFDEYPQCRVNGTELEVWGSEVCFKIENNTLVYMEGCPALCRNVWDTCFNQFIVWVGPFLVSLGLLFLSFFATFLKEGGTVEDEALRFTKIWFFLLFIMWISACLAGAGAGLSTTLAALTLSSFVASAVFIANSFTAGERQQQVDELWQKLIDNYGGYFDAAKGLIVVTCLPVAIIFLSLSVLVQGIRNVKGMCASKAAKSTSDSGDDDNMDENQDIPGGHLITIEARQLVEEFRAWNLSAVYTYAIYWGAFFFLFVVVAAKFTVLFLSWLIESISDMEIGAVTGILFGVGVLMFLLPPVPGAPIYLTLGIVIVPVGRETLGLIWCILYACGICLILKLFATFLQQKMIGGLLQNSVGVRQLVGVNTPLIRAMKLCLGEPGLGLGKICILCGGPDWPTSVLCGIMGLPLWPILVGTVPVAALVVPTVLAGSFTYMMSLEMDDGQPEFPWAGTAATVTTALAALVLVGFMLAAAYYVEQTMSSRAEELEDMPFDEEVKTANDADVLMNETYEEVTQWGSLPVPMQIILIIAVACMISACYMVQLFQADAFEEYQLTDKIEELPDGDWKNLVKPLGLVSILLAAASLFLLVLFRCWAKSKARRLIRKRSVALAMQVPQDGALDD